ncbi:MAG: MoaD/ThiS family protein [Pseudomonadales bacterium]|nr:MoaD/ThiS family protein [Pseudomonadales bacterium]MCP5185315.1 MoaD/ThiS family protein [Pseudomonadales bacterium]
MARVHFPDNILPYTGGVREAVVAARNVRDLLRELEARYPGCHETLDRASVAIDGQIYQDAFLEPLGTNSDVHFLPRIEGG